MTGTDIPAALNGLLLDAALAYENQCNEYGGLSLGDRKRLAKASCEDVAGTTTTARKTASSARISKPTQTSTSSFAFGTQFVREWKGHDQIVTVVEDGFLWDGEVHASLSAVARAITGTRWNGPRFFGLETKRLSR